MAKPNEEELLIQYGRKLRELFSGPLGEEVLEMMVDIHVMVTNEELDPIIEGERSFVLNLKAVVESDEWLLEEEADDAQDD